MKRWLWLLAGLLVLGLLAACTGGGDGGASDGGEKPAAEQTEATQSTLEVAQGFLQQFGLVATGPAGFSGFLAQGGPLEALLLSAENLPPGYERLFADSASSEDPSLGQVTMAMSMFADEGQQQGVMSMVMQAENEAVLQQGLAGMGQVDFAEIQKAFAAYTQFGIQVTNVRPVDASGLGDGGFGFAFTMDFSALSAALGDAYGEEAPFTTMDMEMIMFVDGSVVGMVVTFAMGDAAPASRPLAEIMAAKVAAAAV